MRCELSFNLDWLRSVLRLIICSLFAELLTVRRHGIRAMSETPAMSGSPPISGRSVVVKEKEAIPKGSTGAKETISTDPPRGTRDFPPEDMRMRTWLFDNFREVRIFCV